MQRKHTNTAQNHNTIQKHQRTPNLRHSTKQFNASQNDEPNTKTSTQRKHTNKAKSHHLHRTKNQHTINTQSSTQYKLLNEPQTHKRTSTLVILMVYVMR